MKALWYDGSTKSLSYVENVEEPNLTKPDDVKIKVAFSGVCGSDFHFMSGELGKFLPKQDGVILGHEFSGTVVEIGSNVKTLEVGDEVSVNPNRCCGECKWASNSKPHFCQKNKAIGVMVDGGWAEYCVVACASVYKLPQGVSLDGGALSEPYSCVIRGWKMMGEMPLKSSKVLIQGAGIIGTMFACLFHVNGYKNVTISEPHEGRRNTCAGLEMGYDVVHPRELDLLMTGRDSDQDGYDVIFDCTGNCKAVQKTISLARRGAFISMFGCCPAGQKIEIEPFQIYWKELKIAGAFTNPDPCFQETIPLLKELKSKGLLDLDKVGVKIFSLQDYEKALASLKNGTSPKVMFKL